MRYFEDLQLQTRKVGLPTFNDFMHREIGNEGCLVQQRIQEIFSEEIGSINTDLYRIQMNVNNELKHYDDVLNAMSKKGVKFLSQPGFITKDNVLLARDGLNAATKMVGLDISKYLKFKPWGATKLANGLGSAVAILGVALEVWDSYKEQERQAQFAKVIESMISNFQIQSKEVVQLIDAPDFADQFFPTFVTLKQQLSSIDREMGALHERQVRFKKWYDDGTAIDAEFREINGHGGNHQATWESVPEIVIDTTPIIETIAPKAPPAKPLAETAPAKASLWSRLFS